MVDSPVEDGSDAFQNVFEEGLGFSFTIPGVDADVSFNLPWKKYLPKVTIDNGGFITASIGSDLFAEKLEGSKVAWQSQDMKDLQHPSLKWAGSSCSADARTSMKMPANPNGA